MPQRFPPFAGLKAFYVAAQTDTLRRAAEILGVSESAISHEIRRLETYLGLRLFERHGRTRRLTVQGNEYQRMIAAPMAQIALATEALAPGATYRQVRLTLPPTLAVLWFIPRMEALERDLPEVSLHLVTTHEVLDLERQEIDLAIRYLREHDRPTGATCLIQEQAFPVCNPKWGGSVAAALKALKQRRLLVNDAHPDEWRHWLETSGRKLRLSRQRQRFSGSDQAMEAAVGGLGIAIGRRPMVDVYLRERRLVAPFGTDGATGYSYYLIRGKSRSSEAAQRVYEWLIARAEAAPTKAA